MDGRFLCVSPTLFYPPPNTNDPFRGRLQYNVELLTHMPFPSWGISILEINTTHMYHLQYSHSPLFASRVTYIFLPASKYG